MTGTRRRWAVSASTLSVPESGSATYTVKLDTQPVGGDVTVTITGAGGGLTASPTTLTFTATNWSAAQTVTVSAADDLNTAHESATLTHTATGADYGGAAGDGGARGDGDGRRHAEPAGEPDHADGGRGRQRRLPGAPEHAAERRRDGDGGRRDGRGDGGHGRRHVRRPDDADVQHDRLGARTRR